MFVLVTDVFRPAWYRWTTTAAVDLVLLFNYGVAAATVLRQQGIDAGIPQGVGIVALLAPLARVKHYPTARGSVLDTIAGMLRDSAPWVICAGLWTALACLVVASFSG